MRHSLVVAANHSVWQRLKKTSIRRYIKTFWFFFWTHCRSVTVQGFAVRKHQKSWEYLVSRVNLPSVQILKRVSNLIPDSTPVELYAH